MAPSAMDAATSTLDRETGLTPDQISSFNEDGYLIVPNYLTSDEVQSLLTTTNSLLENFPLESHPLTRFTTGDDDANENNSKHVGDDYFLSSGDKVHFFFEPDAVAPPSADDADKKPRLLKPKHLAINKIGHALHTKCPPFERVTLSKRNAAIARSLGFQDPRCLQSMVICKQPGIGGPVPPHRDSEFLYTSPPSAVGWWIALQNATVGNASLGMYKGTHTGRKGGHIRRRFVRTADGQRTTFIENDGPTLPKGSDEDDQEKDEQAEDFEILDVKAGDLVLIHGNVLHKSERNTSDKSRYAYTFHVIEGAETWVYDERNWLQPPKEGFSRLNAVVS
jgi:ectoine hydroxylase-related dioxygenase (phytanoyl-CoA dioxygenase family)